MGTPDFFDMYPSTENITKPAQKLVAQFIVLVANASLKVFVNINQVLINHFN